MKFIKGLGSLDLSLSKIQLSLRHDDKKIRLQKNETHEATITSGHFLYLFISYYQYAKRPELLISSGLLF